MYENYKVRATNIPKNEKFPEYCKNKIEHRSFSENSFSKNVISYLSIRDFESTRALILMTKVDVLESIRSLDEPTKKINSSKSRQ